MGLSPSSAIAYGRAVNSLAVYNQPVIVPQRVSVCFARTRVDSKKNRNVISLPSQVGKSAEEEKGVVIVEVIVMEELFVC